MKHALTIVPNVVALVCSGPCYRGLDVALGEVVSAHESHNLIVTEGLVAWAYNAVSTDGQVIDRLLLGDSASAISLTETAINNQLYSLTSFEKYLAADTAIYVYWLDFAIDALSVGTIKEYGLKTKNTGATDSSNKLVNHGIFDVPIPIESDGYVVFIANLTVKGDVNSASQIWSDLGLNFMASRIFDLSFYDKLDRVAFGTGTAAMNPRESSALKTETHRAAPTWTASVGRILTAGVIASGTVGDLQEMGPGLGASAGTGANYLINNSGGYAKGTTVFALDGGTGTLLVDNYLAFGGVPRAYRVTSALSGGNVTVTPGIAELVLDNAVVTLLEPVLFQDRGATAKGTGANYLINGALAAGVKIATVDTGTGTILVGNAVKYEGLDEYYYATRELADNSFAFLPALTGAVADDATVTVVSRYEADNTSRPIDYYAEIALSNVPFAIQDPAALLGDRLIAWHKAGTGLFQDTGKTTAASSGGDPVRVWADQTSNANDLVAAADAERPNVRLAELNGETAVDFDAFDDHFDWLDMSSFKEGEIWMVIRSEDATPASEAVSGAWELGTSTKLIAEHYPAQSGNVILNFGSTSVRPDVAPPSDIETYHVLHMWSREGDWGAEQNVASIHETSTNTPGFPAASQMGKSNGDAYLNGRIVEIILSNKVQTPTVRFRMNSYLEDKFGITL